MQRAATGLREALAHFQNLQFDNALTTMEDVHKVLETELGQQHVETATSSANLALIHEILGDYREAERLYLGALEVRRTLLPEDHPDIVLSLQLLANLYETTGFYSRARELRGQIRQQLRPGNVHSADNWRTVLEPVVERYRRDKLAKYFRGDAAFAQPAMYQYLEAEDYGYAIRLPANDVLFERVGHLLTRPVGRPPK